MSARSTFLLKAQVPRSHQGNHLENTSCFPIFFFPSVSTKLKGKEKSQTQPNLRAYLEKQDPDFQFLPGFGRIKIARIKIAPGIGTQGVGFPYVRDMEASSLGM